MFDNIPYNCKKKKKDNINYVILQHEEQSSQKSSSRLLRWSITFAKDVNCEVITKDRDAASSPSDGMLFSLITRSIDRLVSKPSMRDSFIVPSYIFAPRAGERRRWKVREADLIWRCGSPSRSDRGRGDTYAPVFTLNLRRLYERSSKNVPAMLRQSRGRCVLNCMRV